MGSNGGATWLFIPMVGVEFSEFGWVDLMKKLKFGWVDIRFLGGFDLD